MPHSIFEGDAAYFDLAAHQSLDPTEREQLIKVADTYRSLSTPSGAATRQEQWVMRAEQCRTFAAQFEGEMCRARLLRLAETYDMLADTEALSQVF